MKNKTKNILCKKSKKLATNNESNTIMLNSNHYLKKLLILHLVKRPPIQIIVYL